MEGINLERLLTTEEWVNIIGKEHLQNFQDSLSREFNISLCFYDLKENPITVWSNLSLLCCSVKLKNSEKCEFEELKALHYIQENNIDSYLISRCYVGMTKFMFPVYFNDKLLAILSGGRIVTDNTTIAPELLEKYYVPKLEESKTKKICDLISNSLKLINLNLNSLESLSLKEANEKVVEFDDKLSKREVSVAKLICKGFSNKKIAETLFISEKTVKTHVRNILIKLDLQDRVHIVIAYG